MNVINIDTNEIRWSAHTPDFPFPWVDLRAVDLATVTRAGETLARGRDHQALHPRPLWVIEPSGAKGQYKARMKTEEELYDPVAAREQALGQLREMKAIALRAVIEADVDPDLVELTRAAGVSIEEAVKRGDRILADYKSEKAVLEAVPGDIEKI